MKILKGTYEHLQFCALYFELVFYMYCMYIVFELACVSVSMYFVFEIHAGLCTNCILIGIYHCLRVFCV